MIVYMKRGATEEQIKAVLRRIEEYGNSYNIDKEGEHVLIGIRGDTRAVSEGVFEQLPGVARVIRVSPTWKEVSREFKPKDTSVDIGNGVKIGGGHFAVIAGPCAVESYEQLIKTAEVVKAAGGHALRGGAFKPRTSPYAFQGLGEEGLKYLKMAKESTGLPIVTEIIAINDIELFLKYDVDVFQVGARNCQNYALLKELAKTGKPILLKRGMATTIEEYLNAAEYLLSHGNSNVILCERGIRTFETASRNTTDVNAIPIIKQLSHLPIIGDPSHSTGKRNLVASIAYALAGAGCDGLIIEAHYNPLLAKTDADQQVDGEELKRIIKKSIAIRDIVEEDVSKLYNGGTK